MSEKNQSLQVKPNECSSCKSWKTERAQSKSRILNMSSLGGKTGLCVGGGFDGSHTQSDETCSMWKPIIDKDKVLPIFYPRGTD